LKTSMARGGVDKKENLISSHETTRLHQILFLPPDTKTSFFSNYGVAQKTSHHHQPLLCCNGGCFLLAGSETQAVFIRK